MRGRVGGTGASRREGHPGGSGCLRLHAKILCVSANDRPLGQQTKTSATHESAFLKACRREPVPHTPVWFMRQAGRSLPEYLKVREGIPMLDSCMMPELVAEITMQPVRRHKVDAAIYFSDIVVPLKAIGIDLDIKPGIGPVIADPIRTRADLARLRDLTPEDVHYVTEAIGLLTAELGATPSSASRAHPSPSRATSWRAARPATTSTPRP